MNPRMQDLITCVCLFPPNSNLFLSGSRDFTVRVWDRRVDRCIGEWFLLTVFFIGVPLSNIIILLLTPTYDLGVVVSHFVFEYILMWRDPHCAPSVKTMTRNMWNCEQVCLEPWENLEGFKHMMLWLHVLMQVTRTWFCQLEWTRVYFDGIFELWVIRFVWVQCSLSFAGFCLNCQTLCLRASFYTSAGGMWTCVNPATGW